MSKKKFIPALLFFICSFCFSFSVKEAVDIAVRNNAGIKQVNLEFKELKKQKLFSRNYLYPDIAVYAGGSDTFPPVVDSNAVSIIAGISAEFKFNPYLIISEKIIQSKYEEGMLSLNERKREVELQVRRNFYSILNLENKISNAQKSIDASRQTYELLLDKYINGKVDQITLLTSQYEYRRKLPKLNELENSLVNSLELFKQFFGVEISEKITLDGSINDVLNVHISEDLYKSELNKVYEVIFLENSIKSAELKLKQQSTSIFCPDFSIVYNYNPEKVIFPDGRKTGFTAGANSVNIKFSCSPGKILPGSREKLEMSALQTELAGLKIQLENAKISSEINRKNGMNAVLLAQKQLGVCHENLALMQLTYDLISAAYTKGTKDFRTMINAEDELNKAKELINEQELTVVYEILNLEKVLGIPFGTLGK